MFINRYKLKHCLIIISFLFACNSAQKKTNQNDTTIILNEIFKSKGFIKENEGVDTIFLLKTKIYNQSWPKKNERFKIIYIKDIPQEKILNFGPGYPYDSRLRISIFNYKQSKDTLTIKMLSHGPNVFYIYKFINNKSDWKLFSETIETGGRKEYYGFENDQWYLDLKKKIKPTKPLFPPPEPKKTQN